MKHMALAETIVPILKSEEGFTPIRFCEIEISQSLPDISAFDEKIGQQYRLARCLIRLHTQPLGMLELELDETGVKAEDYSRRIWQKLGEQINEHLRADGLCELTELDEVGLPDLHTPQCLKAREAFLQTAPFASIILCTRDRPDGLARCLVALLAQYYPFYEVIVVDNAPSTSATAELIHQKYADEPTVRYMCENCPGLSSARNRGIQEARGEIIAFTDDDVVVDTYWLAGLARGFRATENVACVTSLILPMELESPAQLWFEEFGGFNKGFIQHVFDKRRKAADIYLHPFAAGRFGTGAGMAFTASFLREKGGFDQALGVGSLTGGGEDLATFFQVIESGNRLVYEPASLAYHEHRRDYANLERQMYFYGSGLTAYLTKIVIDNPFLLFKIIVRIPRGLLFILSTRAGKSQRKIIYFTKDLTKLERKGMLQGPFLYIKSLWKGNTSHRSHQVGKTVR
jgi:glycosyltransferase involved in cell wall biosynthesis